jgi:pimeloyl-ACP methyl ester carboxylesterase
MDIAALLDVLAIRRATIVGHSMGASVAQRLALDHPDRVQGLVLIGAFAALGRNLELAAFGKGSMLTLTDPIDPAFAEEFQRSTLARPIPDAVLAEFVAESLAVPAAVWSAAWAALAETDFTPELAKITAPTLLIRGEEDTMARAAEQDIMQAAIPDCRLTVLKGGGHAPHWEDPAEVASLITRFMGTRGEDNVGQRSHATGGTP